MKVKATVSLMERVNGVPSVVYGTLKAALSGREVVWSAKYRTGSRKWDLEQDYGSHQNRLIQHLLANVSRKYTESF